VLATLALALASAALPARVQVAADEFRFVLSRQSIAPGPALIELANFGEDEHDLRVRRLDTPGTRTWQLGRVLPGEHAVLEATLRPGRYRLWCAIGDHRARGMHARLVVTI
jgi:plastocyanin